MSMFNPTNATDLPNYLVRNIFGEKRSIETSTELDDLWTKTVKLLRSFDKQEQPPSSGLSCPLNKEGIPE